MLFFKKKFKLVFRDQDLLDLESLCRFYKVSKEELLKKMFDILKDLPSQKLEGFFLKYYNNDTHEVIDVPRLRSNFMNGWFYR